MLFLGLGTGLGSTLIVDGVLAPLELARRPYEKRRTYEDVVGLRGPKRLGKKNGADAFRTWWSSPTQPWRSMTSCWAAEM